MWVKCVCKMLSESSSHFPKYIMSATAIIKHHGCLRYLSVSFAELFCLWTLLFGVFLNSLLFMKFLGQTFVEFLITVIGTTENKLLHLSTLHPTIATVANISDLFSLLFASGGWEMPQWPRTHAALAKDHGSAATIQIGQLRTTCESSSRVIWCLCPSRQPSTLKYTYPHTEIQTFT